ncbi:MAG: DUF3006 domain-containing protein [Bacillota bacterium]|nr:DUF3006 domain-containing protein [Bacillota bacterium]
MRFRVFVDRIEENVATLLVGPEEIQVNFPVSCLPTAYEGAILEFTVDEQPQEERARRAEVEGLLAKLLSKKKGN